MGRDRRQAHSAIAGVNQHAGFVHLRRQLMNMLIINADQQCRFGLLHLIDKQRGITFHLLQRAVAQPHLMRLHRLADPLNDFVVEDVTAYIKGARRGKDHQVIQQQATTVQVVKYALLLRHGQHFVSGGGPGIGFTRQHPRHRTDGDAAECRNFAYFQPLFHSVIAFKSADEKFFITC